MPPVDIALWGGRHITVFPAGWALIALAVLLAIALAVAVRRLILGLLA